MKDPFARFQELVRTIPDQAAVVTDTGTTSYADLGSLVARIASAVSGYGNNPRVLIYLSQGADAYAAMFGTLMAGGYYSPVNLDAPIHRHIEIFQQFQPDLVVSTSNLASALPCEDKGVAVVDIDRLPSTELQEPLSAHDLAYVIFTSGSTGQPKGVMIPRRAIAHYTEWAINAMNISTEDRWSQHPNIGFDLSVLDIYGALCGGATLYPLIKPRDRLLPADFIRRHQLTIWDSVPSVIDLMIKARQVNSKNFSSLRMLTFCGEPLFQRHLEAIFAANNDVLVHNTYGPTEATVSCSLIKLTADNYPDYCDNSVALGRPISGMEFMLDGGTDHEGELVLLGEQLAAGYWQNEAETNRAFISVESSGEVRRAYRTGDWVSRRNGNFYFVSRIDSQVKIRGNRVELDEIDSAIADLGFGNSCTVYTKKQLHTFLEISQLPAPVEFRTALATRVPEYEIPDQLHMIKQLPRNNNDKIDRKTLMEMIDQ